MSAGLIITPDASISPGVAPLAKEDRIRGAVAEFQAQDDLPLKEKLSAREICQKWNVNRTTVGNRLNGARSIAESNGDKAHFSTAEAEILLQLIIHMARRGFPLNERRLEDLANTLLLAKHCGMAKIENMLEDDGLFAANPVLIATAPTVGKKWSHKWLSKYQEWVKKYKGRGMDALRANALNPESVEHWFELVRTTLEEYDFQPENIWGMDETCGWNSTSQQETVIGPSGIKIQYMTTPINRDSNTLIVSTSAAGQVLHPYCIFSGQKKQASWSAYNPLEAETDISKTGYTSDVIGLRWLESFNEQTESAANGAKRLLLLDGHHSHRTYEFLMRAKALGIVCLGYPPHTTHALQPLDVVGFSQFKQAWAQLLFDCTWANLCKPTKELYLGLINGPFLKAFTEKNIKAGFRKTGIWPWDPSVITPAMMAPSIPQSINAGFPLPQPSPVRAFVNLLDTAKSVEVEATDLMARLTIGNGTEPQASNDAILQLERLQSEVLAVRSILDNTRSSYLLSDDPISPSTFLDPPIIAPVHPIPWASPPRRQKTAYMSREQLLEHVGGLHKKLDIATTHNKHLESALDGANAQMVIQHLHVRRLDRLRAPDAGPARYTFFPGGKGLELTSETVLVSIRERIDVADEERMAKEARKRVAEENRANAEVNITRKNAANAAWEREKVRAAAEVEKWKADGSEKGMKPVRRKMEAVKAPYLAGEMVIEEVYSEESEEEEGGGGFNVEEESFEGLRAPEIDSGESERSLGSDDSDYEP